HSMADPELYRLKAEVEEYRRRDCIERLKQQMQKAGMLDDATYKDIVDRVEQEVEECVLFADASPNPPLSSLYDHILRERNDD
ncbi:MAG: thiamine pyrophosphate-dependent enzyme, partial [Dehalococcoidia bacterium]